MIETPAHGGYPGRVQVEGKPTLRNSCPNCGSTKYGERRNYDMMLGEAELWCGKCNIKIRNMDFG